MKHNINRSNVVLAEKQLTNKWLAEHLRKDNSTISKWCTKTVQPNLDTLVEISRCFKVDFKDLRRPINEQ